jgi:transposase-like protein
MLDIVMRGVSTRQYPAVLPEMADSVGISRSAVSRQTIEASEAELKRLLERPLGELDLLILYLDGLCFGEHHVISAVGVDSRGTKHVLGVQCGATENAAAVEDLLQNLIGRGLDPQRKYLFVIDGSKALRAAIRKLFGSEQPVQRCRAHKLRNVLERLPREERHQVRAAMRAAWRLEAKEGMARLRKLADWLEKDHHAAAESLLEGMEECFTINRLGVPPSLQRCLATTNLIESPQSGVRMRTRRVTRWRSAEMVLRWTAAAFLATEKNFRRIQGYNDLWMLQAILNGSKPATRQAVA